MGRNRGDNLWKEGVLLKRETYTASDRSAAKVNIRRIVNLKREALDPGGDDGARLHPYTVINWKQKSLMEQETTTCRLDSTSRRKGRGSNDREAAHRDQGDITDTGEREPSH